MLRLLFISVSGLAGGLLFAWVTEIKLLLRLPAWIGLPLFCASCALGGALAWRVCGRPKFKLTSSARPDYEKLGLLSDEPFSAKRAFEVQEYEDEGLHFFLELDDGRVLFLCGQYLYGPFAPPPTGSSPHQEIADDPELNQAAQFPCTKFVVRRHKLEHWVHSIECHGPYLKPEVKLPNYSKAYIKANGHPSDRQIFETPYETLREQIGGRVG